ncbi:unannotated protein [freshwater metagenome]|jgi:large subunit ribosomal protein L6|uniref:Unannotated protein n=1 Tax=freshwater metagenome TaxID=449393 RepID=A0A6J7RAR8_9ZZZZ|nr:50S ribosomal protein L6 [Actinomycetota bacterium]MSV40936.1 50S ribosomal protein L6 [Actinomycetota bacterium]MSV94777.1 50S ribosomal protein L6 [Actinomycetota bacterium]MSW61207.1 50S ribosomal protein L6 [Actinomycetota bacterium]MSY44935.1 50S ribosomal protein L6 [Actinomycetota bacterium]
MSRIGQSPIAVPSGVEITLDESRVIVKGSKGSLEQSIPESITITQEGDTVLVARIDDARESRSLHGLMRSLVANMVQGVTDGFTKELEIIGVGYRAAVKGSGLELQLGFSHPVLFDAPTGITFATPQPTRITITGFDKQLVGQVAADIRKLRKPEPYKGKGIRYVDERVLRKSGKSAK